MNRGQQLKYEHHVVRHVSWTKLRRDGDDNVLGFLGQAFELRETEVSLSVNWLEYFDGGHGDQRNACINEFRKVINVKPKSAFGIANVGKIKELCGLSDKPVRIVYTPSENNPSHSSIQKLPRDDIALLDLLAVEAFTELVLNSAVPMEEAGGV